MAALVAIMFLAPTWLGAAGGGQIVVAMAKIAAWIVGPSLVVTVISGLLAIVANPVFQDLGWVWVKAATGLLMIEGGLHVMGPIQDEAKQGAEALARAPNAADLARLISSERDTLWVLLAVSAANIALGVWRPRMPKIPI